jgi:hypothetical protein
MAPEPSSGLVLPHEYFTHGLHNTTTAYVDALVSRRAGKVVFPDYNSDSYEFEFKLDRIEPESGLNSIEESLSGPTTNLVIMSTIVSNLSTSQTVSL